MYLIHSPLASWDGAIPEVSVNVDRQRLARRFWRAAADDGTEFGAEVETPLKHGDVIWASANTRYVIRQAPEAVLEILLAAEPGAATAIGWTVGNLHVPIETRGGRLLVPDDPGLRQALDRLDVRYVPRIEVFEPRRLAGSLAGHGQLRDCTREPPRLPDAGPFIAAETPPWVAGLLQTADSFYPTGAYAHSHGLEGLVQSGVVHDRATLRTFLLDSVLPALARADLALAVQAWKAAGEGPDWVMLRELCFLGAALRGAREPRDASWAVGRQRLELIAELRGGFAAEFNRRAVAGEWPTPACLAAAAEGRTLGAPLDAVLAAIIYTTAAGFIAASVKLLRLGQNACQSLLTETLAQTPVLIAQALLLDAGDIGTFNPWWDIAAARHETADFRLFIS
jgi:urease accessory protein